MKNIATTEAALEGIRAKLGVKPPSEIVPFINALFYGEPGAGKTYLAATAQDSEETSPILFVDIEGGAVTIRKRKDVDVKSARTMKDIENIHNELYNDTSGYYKTVILDSITELQKLDMRTVMQEQFNKKPDSTDIDVPSQREWGKSGERMRRIIRGFRDLPMNTICTALLGSEFDEANSAYNYFPLMPGKLRAEVPGYFDIVGYLRAEEVKIDGKSEVIRKLQVAKTRRVVAKDRTGSLGDVIESPSIPLMWALINE